MKELMKKDNLTTSDLLAELKDKVNQATAYVETMYKHYSLLEKDSRFSERTEDSAIRADCYLDCTLVLKALVQTD